MSCDKASGGGGLKKVYGFVCVICRRDIFSSILVYIFIYTYSS
mgnify:CR=1 FL=1